MNRREFLQSFALAPMAGVDMPEEQPWAALFPELYPVQRFIVKLVSGIELDRTLPPSLQHQIRIRRKWDDETPYVFTEAEYLRYLHDQGRSNLAYQERPAISVMAMGRRSGMSFLSAVMAVREMLRLYDLGHPQQHYELPNGHALGPLLFTVDATSRKEALTAVKNMVGLPVVQACNGSSLVVYSVADTQIRCYATSAGKQLKGQRFTTAIMDGFAHFNAPDQSYYATAPAILPPGGLTILSTPLYKGDRFHEFFESAKDSREARLALQIPTWEANPSINMSFYYRAREAMTDRQFRTEVGAEFLPPV